MLAALAMAAVVLGACASPRVVPETRAPATLKPVPATSIAVFEDHDRALPSWVALGARDRIVVHVDAHDDFRLIDEERLAPLRVSVASSDATGAAALADNTSIAGSYNLGDYLYAAAETGIIRKIVWVVPDGRGSGAAAVAAWQTWLRAQRYPESDIATFVPAEGGVAGTLLGTPVTIVALDRFEAPDEPVLLDIDVDFFPEYMEIAGHDSAVESVREALTYLLGGELQVEVVTIATSVTGDYLPLQYKWLSSMLYAALANPSILTPSQLPDRWAAMGEAVALESTDTSKSAELWGEAASISGDDPAPWFGLGRLLIAAGLTDDGVVAVDRAAALDPSYARGWLQLAAEASARGDAAASVGYARRAEGLVDDYSYRLRLGDMLYNAGDYPGAVRQYETLAAGHAHPDVWMYLGDAYDASARPKDAERAYREGARLLERATFRTFADYPDALPALGRMAVTDGELTKARTYLELYLSLRPQGPEADSVRTALADLP